MTPDEIRKDFTYKFGNELMEPGTFDRILFYVMNAVKKESQAYGGCTICYGKGYSTERVAGKVILHYCRCDRGLALEKLISKQA